MQRAAPAPMGMNLTHTCCHRPYFSWGRRSSLPCQNPSIYCSMRFLHGLLSAQIALDLHEATVCAILHTRDITLSLLTCSTLPSGREQKVSTCRSLKSSKQGWLDLFSSSVSLLRCTRRPTLICRPCATTRSENTTSHENLWRKPRKLLNQQVSDVSNE